MTKPVSPYLLLISGLLLMSVGLQSCQEKSGTWKNDEINSGKRADFHAFNTEALGYLKANNPAGLKALLSKELIDNSRSTGRTVELISNRLTDNNYTLFDEFYVVNKFLDADTVRAKGIDINRYGLSYPGTEREMYIAFFLPKSGANKYLISTIYAKYSYGWKIKDLELSPYTINGKTAPELYKLAKEEYDKKYLVAAQNSMMLANTCLKPCEMWQYPDETEINDFYAKVVKEMDTKYKFPFLVKQLATKPMILRVYNTTNDQGSYPMVYYMTHIDLADTNAVKKENALVKKALSSLLPGIDKDKKYVYYDAFNKFPNGSETVDHFDMIDKLQ